MAQKRVGPSREEIALLSRWAQVAYAVRAAERVRPLLDLPDSETPAHIASISDGLIHDSRYSAKSPSVDSNMNIRKIYAIRLEKVKSRRGRLACLAISHAYAAACYALKSYVNEKEYGSGSTQVSKDLDLVATCALLAAKYSAEAIWIVTSSVGENSEFASVVARWDFKRIFELAGREQWDNSTAVDTARLGCLWPSGPPENWPLDEAYKLILVPPSGVSAEKIRSNAIDLLRLMDRVQRAWGGHGLVVEHPIDATNSIESREPVCPGGGRL